MYVHDRFEKGMEEGYRIMSEKGYRIMSVLGLENLLNLRRLRSEWKLEHKFNQRFHQV